MRSAASILRGLIAVLAVLMIAPSIAAARPTAKHDSGETAIIAAVNVVRAQNGLKAVKADPTLARAADFHTVEMLNGNYFAHGAFSARVRHYTKARSIGENLALLAPHCGRSVAAKFVAMWMASPPHRAVLLSKRFAKVGIGARGGKLNGARACVVTADFSSRH
jgi:uncharacterized protein YkwD